MKTREDLVKRALQKLHVLAAGQAASAEDNQLVDDALGPVLSSLSSRNIYPYGDPDQIEEDAFEHLADLLAYATAGDFGRTPDRAKRIEAETLLREISAETLSYQPAKAEYF